MNKVFLILLLILIVIIFYLYQKDEYSSKEKVGPMSRTQVNFIGSRTSQLNNAMGKTNNFSISSSINTPNPFSGSFVSSNNVNIDSIVISNNAKADTNSIIRSNNSNILSNSIVKSNNAPLDANSIIRSNKTNMTLLVNSTQNTAIQNAAIQNTAIQNDATQNVNMS